MRHLPSRMEACLLPWLAASLPSRAVAVPWSAATKVPLTTAAPDPDSPKVTSATMLESSRTQPQLWHVPSSWTSDSSHSMFGHCRGLWRATCFAFWWISGGGSTGVFRTGRGGGAGLRPIWSERAANNMESRYIGC